ncbi:putative salivary secreted peptide [Halictus rubicundus]|uniref:putative salivary secreted peptide n=1 Tax=Halictus rubicundus TaxID=77578 RepID=UPI0040372CAD
MSSQKVLVCLAIAVIAVIIGEVTSVPQYNNYASNGTNKSHNLVIGYRQGGDRLVLRQSVIKKSAWLQVQSIQKSFNTSQWERITMVKALDQKTNGNGAYASLLGGGPGYNNVVLKFKSQRGHGINFIVELYAR